MIKKHCSAVHLFYSIFTFLLSTSLHQWNENESTDFGLFVLLCLLLWLLTCSVQKKRQEWVIRVPHPGQRCPAVHISQDEMLIHLGFHDSQARALPHKSLSVPVSHQLVRAVLSVSEEDLYFC